MQAAGHSTHGGGWRRSSPCGWWWGPRASRSASRKAAAAAYEPLGPRPATVVPLSWCKKEEVTQCASPVGQWRGQEDVQAQRTALPRPFRRCASRLPCKPPQGLGTAQLVTSASSSNVISARGGQLPPRRTADPRRPSRRAPPRAAAAAAAAGRLQSPLLAAAAPAQPTGSPASRD